MPDGSASIEARTAGAPDTGAPVATPVALKKVAILGCAFTSVDLAPWDDPEWEIWGCSGALHPKLKRYDRWFELHHVDSCRPLWTREYVEFLKTSTKPVYLTEPHPEIPAGVAFPQQRCLDTFGPWFFTSSIAWMLALALIENRPGIGLWGVDMAAGTEYDWQRPGCQHFIAAALHRGIDVVVPPESSILMPYPMYWGERDGEAIRAVGAQKRIEQMNTQAQQQFEAAAYHRKWVDGYTACFNEHVLRGLKIDPKAIPGG